MDNKIEDLCFSYRQSDLASTPVLERPTLRFGDQGEFVTLLQSMLKHLMFYNENINGIFDNNTLLTVKAFQTNNRLPVDGVVGKDTWSALIYLYSPLNICETSPYIVQPGDTLWSIARRYNTTVSELMQTNNLTSQNLSIGQQLTLPGTEAVPPPPTGEPSVYTVKAGDTLWELANRYNTTVSELMRLNNLSSPSLSIGQKLITDTESVIPEPVPPKEEPSTYTVRAGDTLWELANRYNTTVSELMRLNNLSSSKLSVGKRLTIPGAEVTQPGSKTIIHTVRRGDNLWDLSKKYNTTVNSIKKLNNLSSNLLNIGQVLTIKVG